MNIIFDFGNVLVRWEPQLVFLPYFGGNQAKYDFFWNHVIDAQFRDRIDAGEDQMTVIREYQERFPEYAEPISMYYSCWEESLPGEVPGMFDLVSKLKSNSQNHIYGLTNWSCETYPQARKKFAVLQLIDDYVISGAENMVKPSPEIFKILLDRFGLMPDECIFVDDRADNVAAACRLGFKGIVFRGAEDLRSQLEL